MREQMIGSQGERREYWNRRVVQFGHTGWSNPSLYKYDQRARIARILQLVQLDEASTILDFGCGTGELTEALARRYPKSWIVGIDVSDKVIEVAKKRLHSVGNITLMTDEIDSALLTTGTFDLILSITVLQHIKANKLTAVLDRFAALLRAEGRVIVLENVYRAQQTGGYIDTGFSEKSWHEMAAAAGFRIDRTTSYPHWGAVVVETILPMLRCLREKLKKRRRSVLPNAGPSVAPGAGIAARLVKFLLALTWPLDHFLRLPLPRRWRHYAIFVVTKR